MPSPFKVPNPLFPSIRDISLFTLAPLSMGPVIIPTNLRGSSWNGQRPIAEFFLILDHFTHPIDYKLQKLDDERHPLAEPPVERSSPGNIVAGNYLIAPVVEGGEIFLKELPTIFNLSPKSRSKPRAKEVELDEGGSTTSEGSRDDSDDSQGFKMRLVYRDKGCVVCLAAGIQNIYEKSEDSDLFEGAHIIGIAYDELWDSRGYSALVTDPFTDPAHAGNPYASPTTRDDEDPMRINSLENGILLCSSHHSEYENFNFGIHPDTHKIYAFHPETANLHGFEVKAPWERQDVLFPPPHPAFLELHYFTSVSRAMKGSGNDSKLRDNMK